MVDPTPDRWIASGRMEHDDTYTHGHHESVLRSHRWRTADNSARYLLPYLKPGMNLLDVGCGPGTITAELTSILAPGSGIGIDQSPEIVAAATAEFGYDPALDASTTRPHFQTGDVYNLGFDDDSFDVVHAHQVLQHLSDPVAALTEMARVCAPDGWIAVRDADYEGMTWAPTNAGLDQWMSIYQKVARANNAEPNAGRYLLGWANQVELTDIRSTASVWCFSSPEDRQWWGGLWSDRTTTSDFARQAVDYGFATTAELATIALCWQEWAAHRDAWFTVLHGEILARPKARP